MKNLPLLAFFTIALLHLFGLTVGNNTLVISTKPLLMPLLGVWLIATASLRKEQSFLRNTVLGALVFSTLGDVLLMFSEALYFLLGLGSFLLAHVFYITAFSSISDFKNGFLSKNYGWAIPFLAFPALLLIFLWEGIPADMKLPVAAYAGVISLMALSVLNLKGKIADSTFWTLLAGAVLFLISDSLIAIGKFGQPFEGVRLAVMGTYIGGQFLLVWGVGEVLKKTDQ
ncbi:MAG: lysoplasmalogenase [Saprospiraceae bacterium]|nr:lysoplasmalogenase [Saprospiraceae bacterium]